MIREFMREVHVESSTKHIPKPTCYRSNEWPPLMTLVTLWGKLRLLCTTVIFVLGQSVLPYLPGRWALEFFLGHGISGGPSCAAPKIINNELCCKSWVATSCFTPWMCDHTVGAVSLRKKKYIGQQKWPKKSWAYVVVSTILHFFDSKTCRNGIQADFQDCSHTLEAKTPRVSRSDGKACGRDDFFGQSSMERAFAPLFSPRPLWISWCFSIPLRINVRHIYLPIPSMYGLFNYIWVIFVVNVVKFKYIPYMDGMVLHLVDFYDIFTYIYHAWILWEWEDSILNWGPHPLL